MKKTDNKNEIEIKIPFFIPIIIIIIFILLTSKIYPANANTNEEIETEDTQDIEIEEVVEDNVPDNTQEEIIEEIVEDAIEETEEIQQEEPKTITYTASSGKQYDVIATLNIPSLGIEYPILSTTTTELLKVSVTKYWGANPNEVGNMVVIGHNYKNSKFFGKLPNIKNGDIIKITDLNNKTLDYKVYDTYIINPEDNSCTSQLTNGKTEITLITCYYENGQAHATKRFVVKAVAE